MDLEQTRTPELEQDAHDPEGHGDRNRRKTFDFRTPHQTRKAVQVQVIEGNMRQGEAFSAGLEPCEIITIHRQKS